MAEQPRSVPAKWTPAGSSSFRSYVGRFLSFPCYPTLLPFALFSHCDLSVEHARWWRAAFVVLGIAGSAAGHTLAYRHWSTRPWCRPALLSHLAVSWSWELTFSFLAVIANQLIKVLQVDRTMNRLERGQLRGPRVLVVGNGPSAVEGKPLGDDIDKFDEVVRFNNFQTKVAGMEKWVGTKTTVHFSDGVLYPTYKEYNVPGADVVLSLFMDRFMVGGTYLIMRMGADLQIGLTLAFMKDPKITWIEKLRIERLKKKLGLVSLKHPTSGMLAIDYFLDKPGVELPVYIHGFDFFQGPKIHYYNDHEPLYERINNRIGVNQHSPHKEKIYVQKLIDEGKVKFLRDTC